MKLIKNLVFFMLALFMLPALAAQRPTIQFDGVTYYMAKSHYEVDGHGSAVNVVEFYLPQGDTSDNYSKYIKRVTLLQVTNYRETAKALLDDLKQDNKNIPFEVFVDDKKTILNVTFWWPFRTTVIEKKIYVFQEDPQSKRAMYYLVGEDMFQTSYTLKNDDLIKQGKELLLDKKTVDAARALSF